MKKIYYPTSIKSRKPIFEAVVRERIFQDRKWGGIEDHPHTIFEWVGIMEHELNEAKRAWFQRPWKEEMLREILQVIAVGVACLEQHGVVERPSILSTELENIKNQCPYKKEAWDEYTPFDSCDRNGRGWGRSADSCEPSLECAKECK